MWRLCVLCVLLSVGQAAGKGGSPTQTSANKNISEDLNQGKESAKEAKPSTNNMDSGGRDVNQTGTRNTPSLCPAVAAGLDPEAGTHTDRYVRLGSNVLLPVTYNLTRDKDPQKCDEFIWSLRQKGSGNDSRIASSKRCRITFPRSPNYNVSLDGRLTVINVTRNISGNYIFTVGNFCGVKVFAQSYTLHIQAPVSEPLLKVSCLPDGGAVIVCGINTGEDPQFSISVNGISLLKDSSRTAEKASEVHVSTTSPGPWNITCSARNRVSDGETGKSQVKCPVPVSNPELVVGCLHNGSLEISCSVVNGSDLMFSLSENGKYLVVNYTNEDKSVNVTTSSPGPWDVHCFVGNHLMWKKTNVTSSACPVPPSDPILEFSCHNGSLGIICSVEKGSDLIFSLSVNGTSLWKNVTSEQRRVNGTPSLSGPWDVYCSVENSLKKRNTSSTYISCPGSTRATCMSCLQKSVIGGVVALIVTTAPLFLAAFYIGRNVRHDQ
ncbi:uncharacterized protein LOC143814903 isoform X2 [Ranitomeya variabilis]|uniref:uncharacterized protein LOC143814903 isoform X2 n=1 Tax=Ranitomeya variabilis TaxID=490064 RepID=UPI0040567360